jgi:hypothetical protein
MTDLNNYVTYINCVKYFASTHKQDYTFVENPENRNLLFSKAFLHYVASNDIKVVNEEDYKNFIDHMLSQSGDKLAEIKINPASIMKYVDPNIKYTMALDIKCPFYFPWVAPPIIGSQLNKIDIFEIYFMSWVRDLPFFLYDKPNFLSDKLNKAVLYLNQLNGSNQEFKTNLYYPQFPVTPNNIFRGRAPGDIIGPYVSQFLFYDAYVNYNTSLPSNNYFKGFMPKIADNSKRHFMYNSPDADYVVNGLGRGPFGVQEAEYLKITNGQPNLLSKPTNFQPFTTKQRHVLTGRDLAAVVHADYPCELPLKALEILLSYKAKGKAGVFNDSNIGKGITTFVQFSGPEVHNSIGQIAKEALRVVCFFKYHWMRLRPEELAAKINYQSKDAKSSSDLKNFFNDALVNEILGEIKMANNNESLHMPVVYPEGCPLHPSYPAGHAVIGAACNSYIKAMYDDSALFSSILPPVEVQADISNKIDFANLETKLVNLPKEVADKMTIGGELDKLTSNIAFGRNIAGIHYRSDAEYSFMLGELIAANFIQCKINDYGVSIPNGTPVVMSFTSRAGKKITITSENITVN